MKFCAKFRTLTHHEKNRGLSAARNTGTDASTGDYLLYIDSDDEIVPDCVEKLIAPILNDDSIEIVMGNYERLYDGDSSREIGSNPLDYEVIKGAEAVRNSFFEKKRVNQAAWNKLIRKDFLLRFNLSFREGLLWEDTLWIFYVMKHLCHLCIIKDVTYHYYMRPQSITTGTDTRKTQFNKGLIFNEISNNFTPNDGKREAKYYLWWFCCLYFQCNNEKLSKETFQNFSKALPFRNAPLEYLLLTSTGFWANTRIGRNAFHGMRRMWRKITVKG
jgi:glycosyltransferase involved in cell wall biosynthesis